MLLIKPVSDLESTHRSFLEKFTTSGEHVVPWIVGEPYETFSSYVAMLDAASKGIRIPPGFVAHSTFWLVDDARQIVAIANLRHALTDAQIVDIALASGYEGSEAFARAFKESSAVLPGCAGARSDHGRVSAAEVSFNV